MPLIKIEFDNQKIEENEIKVLSQAIQKIVSEATGIEDVFVYANSAQIKVKIAPIEIFVEMSAHKIGDPDKLLEEIKMKLSEWKQANNFRYPIHPPGIAMQWKIEIGI